MSIPASGASNINPLQNSAITANQKEAKADARQTSQSMNDIMTSIKELSQELRNQQMQKVSPKEKESQLQQKTDQALNELKEQSQALQKQVQSQQQAQQPGLDAKDAEVVAAAMAGLMEDEELGDANDKQMALEEKMALLMKQAEGLEGVELSDSDQNFELQKMFENMDKFNALKRKEEQLNKQLSDLDINLKQQETKEALNKLPVDETTKKMREQLFASFDEQQKQSSDQSSEQSSDQSKNQRESSEDPESDDSEDN